METNKQNQELKKTPIGGCIILILLAAFFAWLIFSPSDESQSVDYTSDYSVSSDGQGASLTRAAIIAQDFVKQNFASDCDFEDLDIRGEETITPNRFKVLQKFTSEKLGYEQEFVYRIYIQFYGGEWEDIKNWDFGQLLVENTSTGKQYFYHGTMKKREKITKDETIESAGVLFFVVDQNDEMVRISNINKFGKDKIKEVVENLMPEYKTIIFTTTRDRNHDYCSYLNGLVEDEKGNVFCYNEW